MLSSNASSTTIGGLALAVAVVTLLGLVLLILMYAFSSGPLGLMNDVCNAVEGLLSIALAIGLLAQHQARSPHLAVPALIAVIVGGAFAVAGSVLVMSNATGFFLAGMYSMTGFALIGVWLLATNFRAPWPQGMATFGLVAGAVMLLGLAAIPSILLRIDSFDSAAWHTWLGQVGFLGWAILYPVWCLRLWSLLRAA
jgi:hypothetical protein